MGNMLYLSPLKSPKRALDLGTGTGIWAIHFADMHPECSVKGNDLSPIQPEWVPQNCNFEVDDFNETWPQLSNSHDFIYARGLHGAVSSWTHICTNAYRILTSGGWIEITVDNIELITDDNSLPESSSINKWINLIKEALEKTGKPSVISPHIKQWLLDAGFDAKTIVQKCIKLPVGTWPKKKAEKQMGAMNLVNLLMGLDGFSYALLTRVHGWALDDVNSLLDKVRSEMKNKDHHLYFRVYVTYAQKPKQHQLNL